MNRAAPDGDGPPASSHVRTHPPQETPMSTTPAARDGRTVHRTERDGVPVLWTDLPVDPTVTLFFGVGHQNMTPATVGITHLVEHLVMRRVGRISTPHNAESGMVSTSFYATGTPARLVDFVRRVCDA